MTSTQVRGETWTYPRRRMRHSAAVGFLDLIERSPRVEVAFVSKELQDEAIALAPSPRRA